MKSIVECLFQRNAGCTRSELLDRLKLTEGGTLTEHLNALIAGDYIIKYHPFGLSKKEAYYKLVDPFCLFYLHFQKKFNGLDENFWQKHLSQQQVVSWRGCAFEHVCFNHIKQIKKALGISGVQSEEFAWSKKADDTEGAQIDLLISRQDNVVNMCEIKFTNDEFAVGKDYHFVLTRRGQMLRDLVPKRTTVHGTLITTYGLRYNEYSGDFVSVVTMDDLFAS